MLMSKACVNGFLRANQFTGFPMTERFVVKTFTIPFRCACWLHFCVTYSLRMGYYPSNVHILVYI